MNPGHFGCNAVRLQMLFKSSVFTHLLRHCADRGREVPLVTVRWMWRFRLPIQSLLTPQRGRGASLFLGGGGSLDPPLSLHQSHPSWEEEARLITGPYTASTAAMGCHLTSSDTKPAGILGCPAGLPLPSSFSWREQDFLGAFLGLHLLVFLDNQFFYNSVWSV